MVRSDLVEKLLADYPDLPPHDVEQIVSQFFREIVNQLTKGGRVEIRGFGSFSNHAREGRIGRNPRTGNSVDIAAKQVPFFKPGKDMRVRLND